jgi:hypothetical protein
MEVWYILTGDASKNNLEFYLFVSLSYLNGHNECVLCLIQLSSWPTVFAI